MIVIFAMHRQNHTCMFVVVCVGRWRIIARQQQDYLNSKKYQDWLTDRLMRGVGVLSYSQEVECAHD
jgi:hypothetical protein